MTGAGVTELMFTHLLGVLIGFGLLLASAASALLKFTNMAALWLGAGLMLCFIVALSWGLHL